MISEHRYDVDIVGTGYRTRPESGRVTLDESWSPYVQADLTIPLPVDPAVLAALDPRRPGARVRLTLTQRFGSGAPIAALSAAWAGMTLADVSALYAGQTLAAISEDYGRPYNASGTRPSTTRRLNLGLRAARRRRETGLLDLELASDEALLQDYARAATTSQQPDFPTVRSAVDMALAAIGATLTPTTLTGPVEADALFWEPGVSAWDYVRPIVEAAGLRLYCDERRRWHLVEPLAATEGTLELDEATLTSHDSELLRDGGWYDAMVVTYRWTDGTGTEQVRHDVAALPDWTRCGHVEHERPYPGPGAAAALLARARARGRTDAAAAVSSYDVTPGQALDIDGDIDATGLVTRVEWSMSDDEMTVRSRDLIEDPNAGLPPAS